MKDFARRFPRGLLVFQAASLFSTLGGALIAPYMLIYLHNVRGLSLATAGLMWGLVPAAAVAGGFLGGSICDRVGPRRVGPLPLVASGSAWIALGFTTRLWQMVALVLVIGFAGGLFSPVRGAVLAAVAAPGQRHAAFSLQFAAVNFAVGVGAVLGGLIASTDHPGTFSALFVANGVTSFVFAAVVPFAAPRTAVRARRAFGGRSGYRELLQHRALVAVSLLSFLFLVAGAAWEVGFAPFAKNELGLDEGTIGLVFAVNTIAVVALQFPVMRLLEGRRRMPALSIAAAGWAGALLLAAAGAAVLGAGGAIAVFVVVAILIAACECVVPPAQGALVADLAPDHLRGRALALNGNGYAFGALLGSSWVGLALAHAPTALWPIGALVLAVGAVGIAALERSLPAGLRRVPRPEREVPDPGAVPARAAA